MLSKPKIKFIHSLEGKKGRKESGCFLAEGNKLVSDLLPLFRCRLLVATAEWLQRHPGIPADEIIEATPREMGQASLLVSPPEVLAVCDIPHPELRPEALSRQLVLALDRVQDPGNLGTIVRIADWYGVEELLCSLSCADVYNPKTVQATMGALARVRVHYVELPEFLKQVTLPLYGTFLDGENIYRQTLSPCGVVVMGNEGSGISPEVEQLVTHRLFVPSYPEGRPTSESLNVAVATAVVCAEFRRPKGL
ncbi:MAG: RNA methyltransferase [Porphyromonadaceae bacterium]|nr:RNA methyltransferase [Porphyromonadaceae bacterium]